MASQRAAPYPPEVGPYQGLVNHISGGGTLGGAGWPAMKECGLLLGPCWFTIAKPTCTAYHIYDPQWIRCFWVDGFGSQHSEQWKKGPGCLGFRGGYILCTCVGIIITRY